MPVIFGLSGLSGLLFAIPDIRCLGLLLSLVVVAGAVVFAQRWATVGLVSGIARGLLMIVLSFIGVDSDHPTTDIISVITLGPKACCLRAW